MKLGIRLLFKRGPLAATIHEMLRSDMEEADSEVNTT